MPHSGTPYKQRQTHYRTVYLRSAHWARTAAAARARAGRRCERCGGAAPLDVHHLTYARLGAERPEDLVALCRPCHDLAHNVPVKPPSKKARRKARAKAEQEATARGACRRAMQAMNERHRARDLEARLQGQEVGSAR